MMRNGTGRSRRSSRTAKVVEEQPDLEVLEPWLAGEFRRGYTLDIVGAGRRGKLAW
jgi:hypothetical protein